MGQTIETLFDGASFTLGALVQAGGHQGQIQSFLYGKNLESGASVVPKKDFQWGEWCGGASVIRLLQIGASIFVRCALQLDTTVLEKQFEHIVDWARDGEKVVLAKQSNITGNDANSTGAEDAQDVCRALALTSSMLQLSKQAPAVAEVIFLPKTYADAASCLVAARRSATEFVTSRELPKKKKRRTSQPMGAVELEDNTWWWHDV